MATENVTTNDRCRVCGESALWEFLDLGLIPPANKFRAELDDEADPYPLVVVKCQNCHHVQLKHTVDRELLFSKYHYYSSNSGPLQAHFQEYAQELESSLLEHDDFVVEIGSNDGVLLREFGDSINVLGIDPAENVAAEASKYGVETITKFFSTDVANEVRRTDGKADVVLANNVVGHIDNIDELMRGISSLLAEEGHFIMEVRYLPDLLNTGAFESIYHEHISYFSVHSLKKLAEEYDMELTAVERIDIHGGSIRAYIRHKSSKNAVGSGLEFKKDYVADLIDFEVGIGLSETSPYAEFADLTERRRDRIQALLRRLEKSNKSVVGYGAPAKGNVLLNYCGISSDQVQYITDTTPMKQGTYTPGTDIPVCSPEKFVNDYPDYALLLAWNYRQAILEQEADYREEGGRFIIPAPYLDVV